MGGIHLRHYNLRFFIMLQRTRFSNIIIHYLYSYTCRYVVMEMRSSVMEPVKNFVTQPAKNQIANQIACHRPAGHLK